MSSCRGIIIAGVTNTARTQMAECLLRTFTGGSLFICSGGWRNSGGGGVHPLAVRAMEEVGINMRGQSSTSLEGARRQRSTYDVYVGIDDPYTDRSSDRLQKRSGMREEEASAANGASAVVAASPASSLSSYSDPLLASAMPSHWSVAQDTTDSRQSWTLWSPRDPSIFHENSTRKFQDHLYEGEPLFMRVRPSELRRACRLQRRWEVASVTDRFALETEREQYARVVHARTQLAPLCLRLLAELEKEYGERLMDDDAVAAYQSASGAAAERQRAVREKARGTAPFLH